jgi:hypothetical protein
MGEHVMVVEALENSCSLVLVVVERLLVNLLLLHGLSLLLNWLVVRNNTLVACLIVLVRLEELGSCFTWLLESVV